MRRIAALFAALCLAMAVAGPAAAHTRVVLGFGAVVGPPAYYYPPPVYYYPPPPVYYYPPAPTVTYMPAPAATPAPQRYCREYQGNATIDGSQQPFYGTACLEPDGKWHIVR